MSLTAPKILEIAHQDAERAYRDLSRFRIVLSERPDGWHVKYDLDHDIVGQLTAGGGPHYIIDATTGSILKKTYYQ